MDNFLSNHTMIHTIVKRHRHVRNYTSALFKILNNDELNNPTSIPPNYSQYNVLKNNFLETLNHFEKNLNQSSFISFDLGISISIEIYLFV